MKWWPLLVFLAACDGSDGGADPSDAAVAGPMTPTWHGDIEAIVAENCVSCHREGGAAPFRLDTPELATAMAPAALASILEGRMPPWQPDPQCREYRDQRILSAEQKALFIEWVNAGSPLGIPGESVVERPQVADFEADLVTTPTEAYLADASQPDDYRCFALDARFAEDTFLAGATVQPGDPAVVHHVLVYLVPPERVADLETMDAAEPGPGYTCFGGSGLGNNGPLVGWVPGMVPNLYADGIARFIPAGSRMVMQVHYNTLAAEPAPDLTSVLFKVWDEPQPYIIDTRPQPFLGLEIAAGDAESVQVKEFKNRSDETLEILGVAPHAHLLAKSIRLDLIRAAGESECVIDIPRWDFNWQQSYEFREGEAVRLAPGDRFRLTCVYDNSPANQPVFNGEQLEPRDVAWGEGTLDEMCLNFITVVKPFEPRTTGAFPTCRAACADPRSFGCVADCLGATPDIGACVIPQLFGRTGCANECVAQAIGAQDCLRECLTESLGAAGGIAACMTEVCPAQYTPLATCMDAALADGACEDALGTCSDG